MRVLVIALTALGFGLIVPHSLRAGVYNTEEATLWMGVGAYRVEEPSPWPLPNDFRVFQSIQTELRSLPADFPNRLSLAASLITAEDNAQGFVVLGPLLLLHQESLGLRYTKRVSLLESKEKSGGFTEQDRANLGAYYIRLLQYDKAIRVLTPAARQEPPHFMALANLATAYELSGNPDLARRYRQMALAAWPRTWPGWDTLQLNFYRRVETYHLTLLELRIQEQRTKKDVESVDALFPRVRFVGPSGQYEAGTIASEQWVELPTDAIPVVTQLLLWLPLDNRLYWLLGELLNAQGNIPAAATVFDDLVEKRKYTGPRELRRHNQVVRELRAQAEFVALQMTPTVWADLLWRMTPRGATLTPGAGALVLESGFQPGVLQEVMTQRDKPSDAGRLPIEKPAQAGTQTPWAPDWPQIGLGFVFGGLVAVLASYQLREIRRRRQQLRMEGAAKG